eukprot:2735158-Heterocapsa_arctica.AAC.1
MRSCAEPSASTPRRARHAVCTWRSGLPPPRHRSPVLPSEPPPRRRSPVLPSGPPPRRRSPVSTSLSP